METAATLEPSKTMTNVTILQELDQRQTSAGLTVTMFYMPEDETVSITVTDSGKFFEFDDVPKSRAYDVFWHPYAFHNPAHQEVIEMESS